MSTLNEKLWLGCVISTAVNIKCKLSLMYRICVLCLPLSVSICYYNVPCVFFFWCWYYTVDSHLTSIWWHFGAWLRVQPPKWSGRPAEPRECLSPAQSLKAQPPDQLEVWMSEMFFRMNKVSTVLCKCFRQAPSFKQKMHIYTKSNINY